MVNGAKLVGNVGKAPELKTTGSGSLYCKFSMATSESWKGQSGEWQEETTWHNIVVWGKFAEVMNEKLVPGTMIFVSGKIQNKKYTDNEGKERIYSSIKANEVKILKKKVTEEAHVPAGANGQASESVPDDDLPF